MFRITAALTLCLAAITAQTLLAPAEAGSALGVMGVMRRKISR